MELITSLEDHRFDRAYDGILGFNVESRGAQRLAWLSLRAALKEIERLKSIIDAGRRGMGIDELELCLRMANEESDNLRRAVDWACETISGDDGSGWWGDCVDLAWFPPELRKKADGEWE